MIEIVLAKQPVELLKILKFEGMASSGGEAKMLIADCCGQFSEPRGCLAKD